MISYHSYVYSKIYATDCERPIYAQIVNCIQYFVKIRAAASRLLTVISAMVEE